jgi:hypothetical protein
LIEDDEGLKFTRPVFSGTFTEDDIMMLCLVDVFFNRESAYLWVQAVLLFSPTCSFIGMRETTYRGFSRKMKR